MKKLIFLLIAGTMFVFTACNCSSSDATATDAVEEVVVCADDCQKACCLGCKATEGNAKCIVLEDGSMPCCVEIKAQEQIDNARIPNLPTTEEVHANHANHANHADHEGHDHE